MEKQTLSSIKKFSPYGPKTEPFIGSSYNINQLVSYIKELEPKFDTRNIEKIQFTETEANFMFFGKMLPEDINKTFGIFESYFHSISKDIHANVLICCEYFNTATSKKFLDFFDSLVLRDNYSLYWVYSPNNEDMEENIDEFMQMTGVKIIEV